MQEKSELHKARKRGWCARTVWFFFCTCCLAQAALPQDVQVILPAREVTVKQALDEIQRQTSYKIALDWEHLNPERKVFFPGSRLSIPDVLNHTLAGTNHSWRLLGDQIAIVYSPESYDDPYKLRSAMHRDSLDMPRMSVVRDPMARKEMTVDEIAKARSGSWKGEGNNVWDSLGLAVLNFRVNSSVLEPGYMNNARSLDIIHRTFSNKELLASMDYITITSASSPEGNTAANKKLAEARAMAVKSHLMQKYPFMDRDRIFTFSIGEDWTGLRKMVDEDRQTPYRYQVLHILDTETDNDRKRAALKSIDNGNAYKYISQNMLPYLRGAAACMIYYKEDPAPQVIVETIHTTDTVYVDKIVERIIETEKVIVLAPEKEEPGKKYYWAVKTNLLYDAALLPNLSFEFSIPGRWSAVAGGNWSWWKTNNSKHWYHRIQVAGIEVRKWLGSSSKTPLTGHYLGIYGMGGTYDMRFGRTGHLSDRSYSAGVVYGYSHPIGERLNLDFGIGVGYFAGEYKKYTYSEKYGCYPWQGTFNRSYWGPTKAEISLVWLIGGGKNARKNKK